MTIELGTEALLVFSETERLQPEETASIHFFSLFMLIKSGMDWDLGMAAGNFYFFCFQLVLQHQSMDISLVPAYHKEISENI